MNCPCCNGPLVELGTLGARDWFRCRDCGLDQVEGEPGPEPEEDDEETP